MLEINVIGGSHRMHAIPVLSRGLVYGRFQILSTRGREKEVDIPFLASYRHKGELLRTPYTSLVKHASVLTTNSRFAVHGHLC
jgi:hypothetical protein